MPRTYVFVAETREKARDYAKRFGYDEDDCWCVSNDRDVYRVAAVEFKPSGIVYIDYPTPFVFEYLQTRIRRRFDGSDTAIPKENTNDQ